MDGHLELHVNGSQGYRWMNYSYIQTCIGPVNLWFSIGICMSLFILFTFYLQTRNNK